jgi:hypothetical protein
MPVLQRRECLSSTVRRIRFIRCVPARTFDGATNTTVALTAFNAQGQQPGQDTVLFPPAAASASKVYCPGAAGLRQWTSSGSS